MNRPSVGRIVHFVDYDGSTCRAAIVTECQVMGIDHLAVFGTDNVFFQRSVSYSESGEPGTWHWPERVD